MKAWHILSAQMMNVSSLFIEALVIDVNASQSLRSCDPLAPLSLVNQSEIVWTIATVHQINALIHLAKRLRDLFWYIQDIFVEMLLKLLLIQIKTSEL